MNQELLFVSARSIPIDQTPVVIWNLLQINLVSAIILINCDLCISYLMLLYHTVCMQIPEHSPLYLNNFRKLAISDHFGTTWTELLTFKVKLFYKS